MTVLLLLVSAPSAQAALSSISASGTSQLTGATTTWTVAFTPGTNIPALGDVVIVFPTGFSQTAATATLSHGTATCAVVTLTVTCELVSQINSGTAVTATINSMRNPLASGATGTFSVTSRNALNSNIETDSSATATITASTLTSVSLSGASQLTGATTTWTVAFTTVNEVATNGDIRVVFPSGFTPHTGGASQCVFAAPVTVVAVSSGGTGQDVICTITTGSILAATAVSFTVDRILNPSTVQTTGAFTVQTRTATTDLVQDQHTSNTEAITANTPGSVTITGTSQLTGAATTWNFAMTPVNALANGADVRIVFPTGFVASSGGTSACSAAGKTLTTSVVSGTEVICTLSGSTIAAAEAFTLAISNVKNPTITATTGTFTIQLRSASDVLQEEHTSGTAAITANALSGVAFTGSSQLAGAVTTWTAAFTTFNPVADSGDIRVVFPTGFTTSSGAASVCAIAGKTFTTVVVSGTEIRCVLAGSTLSAAESLSLTLTNVKNPGYTQTTGAFTLQTRQVTSLSVHDQHTSNTEAITANPLSTITISAPTQATGSVETWTVAFTATNAVADGGEIYIVFPTGFTTSSGAATVCAVAGKTFTSTIPSTTEVRCILSGSTIAASEAISLTLTNVKNPTTAQTTGAFTVQTRRATGLEVQDQHTSNTESIVATTLGSLAVSAPLQSVGSVETWTIAFTPTVAMADGADIRVVFPTGFVTSSGAATVCAIAGKTLTTSIASSTEVVCTLSGSTVNAAEAVSLTLTNVKNPTTGQTTGAFTIQTRAPTTDAVQEQHLTNTEAIGAGALTSFSASAPLQQTGRVETWTIAFTTVNAFAANGDIRILFPAGFVTSSGAATACDVASKTAETTTVVSATEIICNLNAATLTAGEATSLTLTNIKNPTSVQTTSAFTVYVRDSGDVSIDQHVTNTESIVASALSSASAAGSTGRYATTESWTFNFATANPVAASGDIRIAFPSGFQTSYGATSACDIAGKTGETTTVSSNDVLCEIGANTIAAGESVTVTISNIRNPSTVQTTGVFTIQTRNSADAVHDQHLTLTGSIVAGAISFVGFSAPLQTTGAVETWTVTFTPGNTLAAGGDLRIVWPAGFIVSSGAASVCDIEAKTGEVTAVVSASELICTTAAAALSAGEAQTVRITNVRNPTTAHTTGIFTLQLRDSGDVVQEQYALNQEVITAHAFAAGPTITPSSLNAAASADYVVNVTLFNAWPANAKLRITFPTGYTMPPASLIAFDASATSPGLGTFTAVPSGQTLTLLRVGALETPAGSRIILTIKGGANPDLASVGSFTIQLLDSLDAVIESGTAAGLSFVGASAPVSTPVATSTDLPLPSLEPSPSGSAQPSSSGGAQNANEPIKIRLAPGLELGLVAAALALGAFVASRRRLRG